MDHPRDAGAVSKVDMSEYGRQNHSEADLAFCTFVADYTSDPERDRRHASGIEVEP